LTLLRIRTARVRAILADIRVADKRAAAVIDRVHLQQMLLNLILNGLNAARQTDGFGPLPCPSRHMVIMTTGRPTTRDHRSSRRQVLDERAGARLALSTVTSGRVQTAAHTTRGHSLDRSIHAIRFGAFGDEETAGTCLTAQVAAFFDWRGQGW
jgi:hypothetical protein